MFYRTRAYVFLGMLLVLLTACVRPQGEKVSISLSLPSQISQSTQELMHVSVNLTCGGVTWLKTESSEGGAKVVPTHYVFENVPNGECKAQLLAVYKDSDSGAMTFKYGEKTQNITADTPINISPTTTGSANSVQGRVSGRYLTGTNSGPSGELQMNYITPDGRSMIVEKSLIANGWFSVFMLSGLSLEYVVNGQKLFGGPVSLENSAFIPNAANTKVTRAVIPIHTAMRYENGSQVAKKESAEINVWGFFASDASLLTGKIACNNLSVGTFSNLKVYSDPPSGANSALTSYDLTSNPFPTNSVLTDTASPMTQVQYNGGQFTACSSISNSAIPIIKAMIDGNGGDSVAGFRNAFALSFSGSGSGSVLNFAPVGGNSATVSGNMLPDVSTVYDRIRFYSRTELSNNGHLEFPSCEPAVLASLGFASVGEVSGINASTGAFSGTVGIDTTSSDYTNNKIAVVACAANSTGVAPIGLYQRIYSGGGGSTMATKLSVKTPQDSTTSGSLFNATCTPIRLEPQTAGGTAATAPGNTQVTFTAPAGYTIAENCWVAPFVTGPGTGPAVGISMGGNVFYVKHPSAGNDSGSISYTVNNGLSTDGPIVLTSKDAPSIGLHNSSTKKLKMRVQSSYYAHTCSKMALETWFDDGTDVGVVDWSSTSVSLASASGLTYYYDENCSSGASASVFVGSGQTYREIYFKYTGAGTSLNMQPGAGDYTVVGPATVSFVQPGVASQVRLNIPTTFSAEACQPVRIDVLDAQMHHSPVLANTTLNFTFNGGAASGGSGFFTDWACTTPWSPQEIPSGDSTTTSLYFRWMTPGSTVNVGLTTSPSLSFSNFNLNVGNLALGRIVPIVSGTTYDFVSDTFTGNSPAVREGESFSMTLKAYSPGGNLISNFNDTDLGTAGINLNYSFPNLNCSAPSWTAGIANINCSWMDAGNSFMVGNYSINTGGGPSPYPGYYPSNGHTLTLLAKAESTTMANIFATRPFQYVSNHCQPILYSRGAPGTNWGAGQMMGAVALTGYNYNLGTANASFVNGFFDDAACGSAITQTTLAAGSSSQIFYAKFQSGSPQSFFNSNSDAFYDTSTSSMVTLSAGSVGAFNSYQLTTNLHHIYGACVPLMIVRSDANGNAVPAASSETINLNGSGSFNFYTNATCTNLTTTTAMSTGDTASLIYVKSSVATGAGVSISATKNASSETGTVMVNIHPTGQP